MNLAKCRPLLTLVPALGLASLVAAYGQRKGLAFTTDGKAEFKDLVQITYSADCDSPTAAQVGDISCDPFGRAYNYPPVWADALHALGIERADTHAVGWGLFVLALGAIIAISAIGMRYGLLTVAFVTLAAASRPMFLMVARGNTDIVIMALIAAACWACYRWRSKAGGIILTIAVAVATGLKMYPIGGALGLIGRWRVMVTAIVAGALLTAIFTGGKALELQGYTPAVVDKSFGSGVIIAQLRGHSEVETVDMVMGIALVLLLAGVLLATPYVRKHCAAFAASISSSDASRMTFMASAGIFGVVYLLTTSFNYRLWPILILTAVAGIAIANTSSRLAGIAFSALGVAAIQIQASVLVTAYASVLIALCAIIATGSIRSTATAQRMEPATA